MEIVPCKWDHEFSTDETNTIVKELALEHLARVSNTCGQKAGVLDAINQDNHLLLCSIELDYNELSVSDALNLRQALAFYSKRSDLDLGIDRQAVARDKFIAAEGACLRTNTRFQCWHEEGKSFPPRVERALAAATRKIAMILGPVPSLEDLKPLFGKGATTQVKKVEASHRVKLGTTFACSEDSLDILPQLLQNLSGWVHLHPDAVEKPDVPDAALVPVEIHAGKLGFVPKNAKTDRSVIVEPMLNLMYQLGIGNHIAARLRAFGFDIHDQTRNQRLAREGSLTGALATLDLSSASDTIASELVWHLLPLDWAALLSMLRTSKVWDGGSVLRLHKFSSMGNGFTFPLETLIFGAISLAVCEGHDGAVSVYGDDIIVPSTAAPELSYVLTELGFTLNPSKSFWTGPFRESCGCDYLSGINIRPTYVSGRLLVADLFTLHNAYVRNFDELSTRILNLIPEPLRIWGPDGYGDGHLIGDWSPKPHKRDFGYGGYTFDTFSFNSRYSDKVLPGDGVLPSYMTYASESRVRFTESLFSDAEMELLSRSVSLQRKFRAVFRDSLRGPLRNLEKGAVHCRDDREISHTGLDAPGPAAHRKGRLAVVLPGFRGYRRISIYTLTPV